MSDRLAALRAQTRMDGLVTDHTAEEWLEQAIDAETTAREIAAGGDLGPAYLRFITVRNDCMVLAAFREAYPEAVPR